MKVFVAGYGKLVRMTNGKKKGDSLPPWAKPGEIVSQFCWELKAAEQER
jgi:hypothetical protein